MLRLVAMQILEVGILAWAAGPSPLLQMRRGLDLNDVGAPVAELANRGRPGTDAGQIEDGKAGKAWKPWESTLRGSGSRITA